MDLGVLFGSAHLSRPTLQLPEMDLFMLLQSALLCRPVRTEGAAIGTLARVHAHMALQVLRLGEGLAAEVARVALRKAVPKVPRHGSIHRRIVTGRIAVNDGRKE